MTGLTPAAIDALKTKLAGEIVLPGNDGYDNARALWNAMIDKHPAVIVQCANTADVVQAVNFARDNGAPLSVRGGGHNIAGSALCDDGVVVDLSKMRAVTVDPAARRAFVEGGARVADVDAATQAHGLAAPLGIHSPTGAGGLTLGGGFGWLSRKHGLAIDNLISAEIVTAAGEVVRASENEHPDLFWALRGGAGNFGAVTRFEFQVHPVGPDVLGGLIVYPLAGAKVMLQAYHEIAMMAPEEMSVWAILRQAPPLPFLPKEFLGMAVIVFAVFYAGDPEEGRSFIEPMRQMTGVLGENVAVQPYTQWQQAFDSWFVTGARNYWKSHNFSAFDNRLLDIIIEYIESLPSPRFEILVSSLGRATTRVAPGATAYAHREAHFVVNVHGQWEDSADDERCIAVAREFYDLAAPYADDGVYPNFLAADEGDRARAAYGLNHRRLAEIKRTYDSANLFQGNPNIKPAAE